VSNVVKILCHAKFACVKCGGDAVCIALAPWSDGIGIVGDAKSCDPSPVCAKCRDKQRESERKKYNEQRRRKEWAGRMKAKLKGGAA